MTVPAHLRDQTREPATASRIMAVLGPTNTGKTHYAIERMLAHRSGMIGLPLRLLAREIYDRVCAEKGPEAVALVTGEEKIVPRAPDYWVCTVESMPLDIETECLAVDEIQLCADLDRGHVFTDRLLRARGKFETLFLGAETMRPVIHRILPHANFITRTRYSDLAYTGEKKLTRLPRRTAVVAFSAEAVYGIAELIRRQRGGAAVVMGALSPRTRNAQVALYQSGDVDFLVATDAIGLGLNMDVDHVAFAALEKFDGHATRPLRAQEIAQISGRAGRYRSDGTFGVTADAEPLEPAIVEQIENHRFDPVKTLQWRNSNLDFTALGSLIRSLEAMPSAKGLVRVREADDLAALKILSEDADVKACAGGTAGVKRLWEVCQVPDFRKVSRDEHVGLLATIYGHLMGHHERIPAEWIEGNIARLDNTEGDIDAIAQRIAGIRTWTYISNRSDWTENAAEFQERARAIEDKLSDALHERLSQRFIDRRTSVLMKRLRAEDDFSAVIGENGECLVENEYVGRLEGFRFAADPRALGIHGKALRAAALRGLQGEIAQRAYQLATADAKDVTLSEHGKLWWNGSVVARLMRGPHVLTPRVELLADEQLTPTARARAQDRLETWVRDHIKAQLAPLLALKTASEAEGPDSLKGPERGMAYRLAETLGSLPRAAISNEVRALQPEARTKLRALGIRFGEFSIFMPGLLKPQPAQLKALLWAIHAGLAEIPATPSAGLTSAPSDAGIPDDFYEAAGFRNLGPRVVRLDMLERLADLIRPQKPPPKGKPPLPISAPAPTPAPEPAAGETAPPPAPEAPETPAEAPAPVEIVQSDAQSPPPAEKTQETPTEPPVPPAAPKGFPISPAMLSLLGCGAPDMEGVLKALGFRAFVENAPDGTSTLLFRPRNRADVPRRFEKKEPRRPDQRPHRPQEPSKEAQGRPQEPRPPREPREHDKERPRLDKRPGPRRERFQRAEEFTRQEGAAPRENNRRPNAENAKPKPQAAPPPREKKREREVKIDPDSPFAALANLRKPQ
ncbi:MAG: disulfide oxidoreductase [Alphaproteobacteria bacterium]|nr:disulfide oxidoreductase [Alphaproteobacteria bacterium]